MIIRRYVVVGAGSRGSSMFALPLAREFRRSARLVAVCDANATRAAFCAEQLFEAVPVYTDFRRMLRDVDPDGLIVATRDSTHMTYVMAGLKAGKRVYSEKPLCVDAAQCRAILAAARRSRGRCFVTHNLRYDAAMERIRVLIRAGTLGRITSMRFDETLDRVHGADYFRRWHRQLASSGGLLVHKASHHFDLLNWWAGALPVRVQAQGRLAFYGRNGAFHGTRCLGCRHALRCAFRVDLFRDEGMRRLYREAEPLDGYVRDGCVFDPSIDICDQMSVQIRYANEIDVAYTLSAFAPYESMRVMIEGTAGRLEYEHLYGTSREAAVRRTPGMEKHAGQSLRLFLPGTGIVPVAIPKAEGGHNGADPRLRAEFFGDWSKPPSDRMASLEEAVQAVLVGAAANRSIATGRPVDVQRLLGSVPTAAAASRRAAG